MAEQKIDSVEPKIKLNKGLYKTDFKTLYLPQDGFYGYQDLKCDTTGLENDLYIVNTPEGTKPIISHITPLQYSEHLKLPVKVYVNTNKTQLLGLKSSKGIDVGVDRDDLKNYNVIGKPTFNNYVVSNLTTQNHIQPINFTLDVSQWEIQVSVITPTQFINDRNIVGVTSTGIFKVFIGDDKKLHMLVGSSASTFDVSLHTTYIFQNDTKYYIRMGFTGTEYYVKYSTDGINWELGGSKESTVIMGIRPALRLGCANVNYGNRNGYNFGFNGSMDLKDVYIKNPNKNQVWTYLNSYDFSVTKGYSYIDEHNGYYVIDNYQSTSEEKLFKNQIKGFKNDFYVVNDLLGDTYIKLSKDGSNPQYVKDFKPLNKSIYYDDSKKIQLGTTPQEGIKVKDTTFSNNHNMTLVGHPMIEKNIISDFSTSNYVKIDGLTFSNNATYYFEFYTPSTLPSQDKGYIFSKTYVSNLCLETNGTLDDYSWGSNVVHVLGKIKLNTHYYWKIVVGGTVRHHYMSFDGYDWIPVGDVITDNGMNRNEKSVCFGVDSWDGHHPFTGSIGLDKTYIEREGNIVWRALDNTVNSSFIVSDGYSYIDEHSGSNYLTEDTSVSMDDIKSNGTVGFKNDLYLVKNSLGDKTKVKVSNNIPSGISKKVSEVYVNNTKDIIIGDNSSEGLEVSYLPPEPIEYVIYHGTPTISEDKIYSNPSLENYLTINFRPSMGYQEHVFKVHLDANYTSSMWPKIMGYNTGKGLWISSSDGIINTDIPNTNIPMSGAINWLGKTVWIRFYLGKDKTQICVMEDNGFYNLDTLPSRSQSFYWTDVRTGSPVDTSYLNQESILLGRESNNQSNRILKGWFDLKNCMTIIDGVEEYRYVEPSDSHISVTSGYIYKNETVGGVYLPHSTLTPTSRVEVESTDETFVGNLVLENSLTTEPTLKVVSDTNLPSKEQSIATKVLDKVYLDSSKQHILGIESKEGLELKSQTDFISLSKGYKFINPQVGSQVISQNELYNKTELLGDTDLSYKNSLYLEKLPNDGYSTLKLHRHTPVSSGTIIPPSGNETIKTPISDVYLSDDKQHILGVKPKEGLELSVSTDKIKVSKGYSYHNDEQGSIQLFQDKELLPTSLAQSNIGYDNKVFIEQSQTGQDAEIILRGVETDLSNDDSQLKEIIGDVILNNDKTKILGTNTKDGLDISIKVADKERENFIRVGNPTIEDGILKNITDGNYIKLAGDSIPSTSTLTMKFTTGGDVRTFANLMDKLGFFEIYLQNGGIYDWNRSGIQLFGGVQANKTYYLKLEFNGTTMKSTYSTDGITYGGEKVISDRNISGQNELFVGRHHANSGRAWKGTIDLMSYDIIDENGKESGAYIKGTKGAITVSKGYIYHNEQHGSNVVPKETVYDIKTMKGPDFQPEITVKAYLEKPSSDLTSSVKLHNLEYVHTDRTTLSDYITDVYLDNTKTKLISTEPNDGLKIDVKPFDPTPEPVFNKIGSVNITNGIASGFGRDNYLTIPKEFIPLNSTFILCFTTNSNIGSSHQQLMDKPRMTEMFIRNGTLIEWAPWHGERQLGTGFQPNTTYYLKMVFTGSSLTTSYGTDGVTYGHEVTDNGRGNDPTNSIGYIGRHHANSGIWWVGSIDLNKSYVLKSDGTRINFYAPSTNKGEVLMTKGHKYQEEKQVMDFLLDDTTKTIDTIKAENTIGFKNNICLETTPTVTTSVLRVVPDSYVPTSPKLLSKYGEIYVSNDKALILGTTIQSGMDITVDTSTDSITITRGYEYIDEINGLFSLESDTEYSFNNIVSGDKAKTMFLYLNKGSTTTPIISSQTPSSGYSVLKGVITLDDSLTNIIDYQPKV